MRVGPYLLGPNDSNWGIYQGDAKVLSMDLPSESMDMVFSDPVYERVHDYQWLAAESNRVLKPNSVCLVWLSYENLPEIINAMCPPLKYVWVLSWHRHSFRMRRWRNLIKVKTACLWLEKGRSKGYKVMADVHSTGNTSKSDDGHMWSKPLPTLMKWIESFTKEGMVVWDPFSGGGSVPMACKILHRRWLGFELDIDSVGHARKFVSGKLAYEMGQQLLF